MNIKIFSFGKLNSLYQPLWLKYHKRLRFLKIQLIETSEKKILESLSKVSTQNIYLLDEQGDTFSSKKFSHKVMQHKNLNFVVGDAYGYSKDFFEYKNRLSLSQMIFPHDLVHILLIEQLYRAEAIHLNHPYHHE